MTCRTWYNGWSPEQRNATIPIQAAARRDGRLPIFRICCLCGLGDRVESRYGLVLHLEDYAHPLEGYPLCKRCHAVIHVRFADPGRWLRLLARIGKAPRWARMLSLDPITQYRPFRLSYVDQLPPPD